MEKKDELTIVVTFLMGLVAGFYFYVTGFAPQVEKVRQEVFDGGNEAALRLTIEGTQYGGCERRQGCASFIVRGDGTYSYLDGSVLTGSVPVTGTLSRSLRQRLTREVTAEVVVQAEEPRFSETCDSFVDGIDIAYTITLDTVSYYVDTCSTMLLQYPAVESALLAIWNDVSS